MKTKKLHFYLEKYCELKKIDYYIIQINQCIISFFKDNTIIEKSLNYIKQELIYLFKH